MPQRLALSSEMEWRGTRIVATFLDGRLAERGSVGWALGLNESETAQRRAILELLDGPNGQELAEPWRTAWRLIEESWQRDTNDERNSDRRFDVTRRMAAGERTGSLVAGIVGLVSPMLQVRPLSTIDLSFRRVPKVPKDVRDLVSATLTSGEVVDPLEIGLPTIDDEPFLVELAQALDAAVTKGLALGRRLGWDGGSGLWLLGDVKRVYLVRASDPTENRPDPDQYSRGLAPSVKLLHSTVFRLKDISLDSATVFVRQWRRMSTPIHIRLWAALAFDAQIADALEVAGFLRSKNDEEFWDLNHYPEVAELRARRFAQLAVTDQDALIERIRRGPPRGLFSTRADPQWVSNARIYWAAREMRRIENAGAELPEGQKQWLDARLTEFADLLAMSTLDAGAPEGSVARFIPPAPDETYNELEGDSRLSALEQSLSSSRSRWLEGSAVRASDWIRANSNAVNLIDDFEATSDGGAGYPKVWDAFGWSASRPQHGNGESSTNAPFDDDATIERVLRLLQTLPEETVHAAIDGIAHWLSVWENRVVRSSRSPVLWLRLWPIAVEVTNDKAVAHEDQSLDAVVRSTDKEPEDLDTLNTPAGRLVGVFLAACRNSKPIERAFDDDQLRFTRDTAISATGRSGLIARYRMTEYLSLFLRADPRWAQTELIAPLLQSTKEAAILWRAVGRRQWFSDVLKVLGEAMAERATDRGLGRRSRQLLIFSLVVESIHALSDARDPAVSDQRVQQMLRTIDDEDRAYAANIAQRYVNENTSTARSRENVFRAAVLPFLLKVWPVERTLTSRGVARAFARFPAACGDAFVEAEDAIDRFLVPFDAWSMIDYGLYGDEGGQPKLKMIGDPSKGQALLRLLDATVHEVEGAVVPSDLGDALDQIKEVAPGLADSPSFRRLAARARR